MALKPVADRVIVKYFETEDKTASGIVLPDSSKEKTQQAEVIAVGSGKIVDGKVVAARQGSQLATAFHPELNDDTSVHAYFVEMIKGSKAQAV